MDPTTASDLNEALAGLLRKYEVTVAGPWRLCDGSGTGDEVAADGVTLVPGWLHAETDLPEATVPLRPWRNERRFLELKRLVEEETIVPVLMCRFACLTDGEAIPLDAALYREFDLVAWIAGAPITRVYAAIDAGHAANVIVRLANDVICSVEVATTLPAGTPMQDRHEIIARRGVASDRVVDTQVAQSSVYVWSDAETRQFTDTDAELFGLSPEDVTLVRSSYEALSKPELHGELRHQHAHLRHLVALAHESDRRQQRLGVKGGRS
jgi:hypothetical protein